MDTIRRATTWLAAMATLAACGGGEGVGTGVGIGDGGTGGDQVPEIAANPVFTALPAFNRPVALGQAPDDSSRWFVAEKGGVLYQFANNVNASSAEVFLDLSGIVNPSGEGGLLSFAFHPDFPGTPDVYVAFTRGSPMMSYVSKFSSTDGGNTLNIGTEQIVLQIAEPFNNHNIGTVRFSPDDFLFVGFGDGGGGAAANGQDDTNLHGTIVRINVNTGSPYAIPPDNPNASNGGCVQGVGAAPCGEIFAWGFRNPWRFSFDRQTGDLWAGDVGQNSWEEIDVVELGANYGWDVREGAHCYNPATGCATSFVDPFTEYDHSIGFAVTGGFVYRGSAVADLAGWYLFGDFVTGRLFAVRADGAPGVAPEELLDTDHQIVSFAEDADGELFFLDYGAGTIYRIENAP